MDGSPSQGDRTLRKATDPYEPTTVHITLLVGLVHLRERERLLRVGVGGRRVGGGLRVGHGQRRRHLPGGGEG